jgi:hypothetical protein
MFVTSSGSAYGRFRRALDTGNLFAARLAGYAGLSHEGAPGVCGFPRRLKRLRGCGWYGLPGYGWYAGSARCPRGIRESDGLRPSLVQPAGVIPDAFQ